MAATPPASPLPPSARRNGARRAPGHLTVGVVQLSLETDLTANRDKVVRFVHTAAAAACRVVVFPETALATPPETPLAAREAAAEAGVYVVVGMKHRRAETAPLNERLLVIGPDGHIVQTYDKRWQDHDLLDFPGLFEIDGVPCAATICADRWLRGIEELPAMAGASEALLLAMQRLPTANVQLARGRGGRVRGAGVRSSQPAAHRPAPLRDPRGQ
jgi:predicted amidohydrolase